MSAKKYLTPLFSSSIVRPARDCQNRPCCTSHVNAPKKLVFKSLFDYQDIFFIMLLICWPKPLRGNMKQAIERIAWHQEQKQSFLVNE